MDAILITIFKYSVVGSRRRVNASKCFECITILLDENGKNKTIIIMSGGELLEIRLLDGQSK